jgi:restriction system protein
MARNAFPTTNGYITVTDLIAPMLEALESLGGSATNEEIEDRVAQIMDLDEAARASLHQGGPMTKFAYRAAWTRSWLKNAGLLENSARGVWSLTAAGMEWRSSDPVALVTAVRAANRKKAKIAESDGDTAEDGPALEDWRQGLLAQLIKMDPSAFERLCQRLLREFGFIKVEVTGRSGDGGIDGTGVLRVNLLSFHVLFQCKRYSGSVGAGAVRDFRGAMVGRTDKGLIITTGTFTADARREATRDGAPAIDLVDGDSLCDLLKDRRLGVSVELVEQVTVNEAAFADF